MIGTHGEAHEAIGGMSAPARSAFNSKHPVWRNARAFGTVALTQTGGTIRIDFAFDGTPSDPHTLPRPRIDRQLGNRLIGGLGFHIVRSMTYSASYERDAGWNRLKLSCAIRP